LYIAYPITLEPYTSAAALKPWRLAYWILYKEGKEKMLGLSVLMDRIIAEVWVVPTSYYARHWEWRR